MAGEHGGYKHLAEDGMGGEITLSGIGLDAFVGKITEALDGRGGERRARQQLIDQVWPLPLTPVLISTPQTVDQRDVYGPKDGWAWDLRFTQLAATGGTLDLYFNQPSVGGTADPGSLSHVAAAASSQLIWGSGVVLLQPGDRFVIVAGAGLTSGTCVIRVTQVPLPILGEYLM